MDTSEKRPLPETNGVSKIAREMTLLEKRALAKQLLAQKRARQRAQDYRLSYGQEALFFIYHNDPQSWTYNEGYGFQIVAGYRPEWVREAFAWLQRRHPVLRTRFFFAEEQPRQELRTEVDLDFALVPAEGWTDAELSQRLADDFAQPFDLERGEVFRIRLYARSADRALLWISMHHIVSDGWSMRQLFEEFLGAYETLSGGEALAAADPSDVYRTFVDFQRQLIRSATGESQAAYWRERLSGLAPLQELPLDRPRPSQASGRGQTVPLRIEAERLAALRALCKRERSTLFALLLANFHTLLFRYHRQASNVVGIPVMNRTQVDYARTQGYFVNTLGIRADLDQQMSFRHFLQQINREISMALDHQDYPFSKVVEDLGISPNPAYNPLFQSFFYLRSQSEFDRFTNLLLPEADGQTVDAGGLRLSHFPQVQKGTRFDLSMEWVEGTETLQGNLQYNTDIFDRATIERLAEHYHQLLDSILQAADDRIGDLTLLSPREVQQLRYDFNAEIHDYPLGRSFGETFAEQVRRQPEAPVIRYRDRTYTYTELDDLTNRLANYLRTEFGVMPEVRVAVSMKRSDHYIIALLAILKAGGAFAPIAPNLPASRREYLLTDTAAPLLLTDRIPAEPGPVPTVSVADPAAAWRHYSDQLHLLPGNPEQLAYVLYTSGSTGQPKGALIEMGGLMNHLYSKVRIMELNSETVIGFTASISFDISIWQALAPLIGGSCVQIYDQETILSPLTFSSRVAADKLSILELVPSHLNEILQIWDEEGYSLPTNALRYLMLTGETLSKELVERWFRVQATIPIINAYGPTEASDDVSLAFIYEPPTGP
ncbi:MAG: condensation domain-containing protein, partial [Bacteroidota bacterium]